ncbi:unnamed protein product, partial [Schistosoma haematobium]
MDFLTCTSCMRNGICLPVTIVKCMVGNELIFCQNKECKYPAGKQLLLQLVGFPFVSHIV